MIFGRKPTPDASRPALGAGRKVTSRAPLANCAADAERAATQYLDSPYAAMPHLSPAGVDWLGPANSRPDWFYSFTNGDGYPVILTLKQTSNGTEAGLFPLAEEDLSNLPIIGYWKQIDPSLTSVGRFAARCLALKPPPVPHDYAASILASAGYPVSPRNLSLMNAETSKLTTLKASQQIASQDQNYANWFIDNYAARPVTDILAALGQWNPAVLPYMQDIPNRIRGLLLESVVKGQPSGVWEELER